MIIQRPYEEKLLKETNKNKWLLVYGRRKTGKTFLVKNNVNYSEYFFVKKDRSILTKENNSLGYEAFLEILIRGLKENQTIVVDEFHRLPQEFFDRLHALDKKGKLILISSTLFLSKNLITNNSPLLGIFSEINLKTINLRDTLKALRNLRINNKEKLELAILLTEPIAIDYFSKNNSAREIISRVILGSLKSIPALVGEIFLEEEREMSAIYEGILRGISVGKITSGALSSWLFSRKLLKKDDPSLVQQYIKNLISFGLIKKIKIFNKKRFIYKISSPLMQIYYYADEKYNLSERNMKTHNLMPIIEQIFPKIVEDKVRETIAYEKGLVETIYESPDLEIDGILLKFQQPEIALEIKWQIPKNLEITKCEKKLKQTNAPHKILFTQTKNKIKNIPGIEIWDIGNLEKFK